MGIHPESFNEREHCWTDYESPSSPRRLQPEFPWPPPDWEHRARAADHCFLAVWSAAVHEPAAATDRVQHNNKLRPLPPFHPFGLFPTTSRLWRSNQRRTGEPVGGEGLWLLGQGLAGEGFKQANLLAVANSFKPKIEFRTNLNNGFQSDIREFDFGSNSLASVREINRYVEDVTNQKIKDLLANDDVDGLTRMVLINAVYFKATWQFAFNADETFEAGFNSPEGSVNVQYMSREADVRMLVDQERQMEILELPYEDPNRSMLIVLPNAGTSTQDLVQRLGGLDLASIRTNGKLAKTSIFIPKFKLKFKTYLKQQMETLGVRDLFAQSANLTGISDEALSASEAV